MARVLVVDDNPDWRQDIATELRQDGHLVETAASPAEMEARLSTGWDIVVLDLRLLGDAGPPIGVDLAAHAGRTSGGQVIILTGFADPETIRKAYLVGVWDYVEKSRYAIELLRHKIRQALLPDRLSRFVGLGEAERRGRLENEWATARGVVGNHQKGRLLEAFLDVLLPTNPGFVVAGRNVRLDDEEIDLVVRNESQDPYWQKEGNVILVEAKNWSQKVGPEVLDRLLAKMERKFQRCRLGILVAPAGFTEGVATTYLAERKGPVAVMLLGPAEIDRLVQGPDRPGIWKELALRAVGAG